MMGALMRVRRMWLKPGICWPTLRRLRLRLLLLLLPAMLLAPSMAMAQQPALIRPLNPTDWALLKTNAEQQTPHAEVPLGAFFATEHFFPALPAQPLLSPDGRWLYYWRRQGLQYWLCRSQGDGEEQVLHKQRGAPPTHLQLSADQQQLWLAAPDLLQVLELRRKTLRTVWQPGYALPGQKQLPPRHSTQVIQLSPAGAVLQWQQQDQNSYWYVKSGHSAQQIWPDTATTSSADHGRQFWRDAHGTALLRQHHADTTAPEQPPPRGLLPEVSQRLLSADGQVLASARLYQRLYWQGATPGWQALLDQLQATHPQCSMQLQPAAASTRLLVSFACSDQPDTKHLLLTLDARQQIVRSQTLQLSAAASPQPGVAPLQVAWQAADQQTIAAHLYLPPGRPLAQSPLVTLIHGGPFSRSSPNYDVLVQWLVNRGVVVLLPDYRSSSGYGRPFLQAARGNFGIENPALTDIFSGLDQFIANGIGDPAQQAVLGHSFGGYLALQALQAQPQRFRFGLALAAPVDLAATLQAYVPAAPAAFAQKPLGQELNDAGVPWQDPQWQQRLSTESPLARLGLLQRPLYLWAGGRDDRISAQSLQQFQQQALAQGKTVRLWLDPASGHQASSLQSRRLQFYLVASTVLSHLKAAAVIPGVWPAANSAPTLDLDTLDNRLQTLEVRPVTTGN